MTRASLRLQLAYARAQITQGGGAEWHVALERLRAEYEHG